MADTVLLALWQIGIIGFVLGFSACYILALILSLSSIRRQQQRSFSQPVEHTDEDIQRRLEFLRHLVQTGRLLS